ncbi:MAG: hypothetical protein GWN29_10590 [Gammaproteobacteria bacterium]|nr:hypothetical protein [Gammaproteobacteria bacterium]
MKVTHTVLGLLAANLLIATAAAERPVEVTLVSKLDEPRGFCFDTLGYQMRARPEEGLQTHTCYAYQGQLAVDQAFDADGIDNGMFRIIDFDLCMTARGLAAGNSFALEPCEDRDTQRLEHRTDGRVVAAVAPELCVTAGSGPSRHGGGGDPVHLIRTLTLEPCAENQDMRQRWRLRAAFD